MLKKFLLPGLLAALLTGSLAAAPGPTESPSDLKAADLLPPSIVKANQSQVLDPVENDGYLNVYRLKSSFGEMKVVSTATLYERTHEFEMIAQMDKLKGSDEFAKAVGGQAGKVVQGGKNLITDPLGTAEKTVTGVGRMFRSIGTALGGGGQSGGDSTLSEASGFASTRRAYAKRFGVDPYSRNPYLQDKLKEISKAGFLGSTLTSMGLGAVGGAAGMALNVASTTESLGEMVSKPPQEVADYCSDRLSKMGVNDDLSDLFLKNENFTVTERTAIVMALDSMGRTNNRQAFIKFAVLTDNPDVASFRRHQAELYATFDAKQKHIQEFRFLDQFATALLEDGSVLIAAPVDRLLWTDDIATYVGNLEQKLASQPKASKMLWLSGTVSPLAQQNLTGLGWQIQQKAFVRPSR